MNDEEPDVHRAEPEEQLVGIDEVPRLEQEPDREDRGDERVSEEKKDPDVDGLEAQGVGERNGESRSHPDREVEKNKNDQ